MNAPIFDFQPAGNSPSFALTKAFRLDRQKETIANPEGGKIILSTRCDFLEVLDV